MFHPQIFSLAVDRGEAKRYQGSMQAQKNPGGISVDILF